MTTNELGALIFAGVILGAIAIIAIIFIVIGTYRQEKVKRAYRKYKDLAKAKREYEELAIKYEEVSSQHRSIKRRIDVMLENEKYLTKVKVFNQQKELEKLRYEFEKLDEESTKLYKKCIAQYEVWKNLRIKYRIDY
jgi:FtsZ-interacting cell division protein ZipA